MCLQSEGFTCSEWPRSEAEDTVRSTEKDKIQWITQMGIAVQHFETASSKDITRLHLNNSVKKKKWACERSWNPTHLLPSVPPANYRVKWAGTSDCQYQKFTSQKQWKYLVINLDNINIVFQYPCCNCLAGFMRSKSQLVAGWLALCSRGREGRQACSRSVPNRRILICWSSAKRFPTGDWVQPLVYFCSQRGERSSRG